MKGYVFLILPFLACSSSSPSSSAPHCAPGENKCFGNYLATCDQTGYSWALGFCGLDKVCSQGQCVDAVCKPGSTRCKDDWTALQCVDGLSEKEQPCALGEQCYSAACLPVDCVPGSMRCIFDTRFTCAGGNIGWVAVPCSDGYGCKGDECVPWICRPQEGTCVKHPSGQDLGLICALNGVEWAGQNLCKPDEICVEGYCLPKPPPQPPAADPGPSEDAAELVEVTDPGPPADEGITPDQGRDLDQGQPDLTPPEPLNWAIINGTKVIFSDLARPQILADGVLMVGLQSPPMDGVPFPDVISKRQLIELRFPTLKPGQTGTFRCEDDTVWLWYRFGKYLQGGGCKDYDYRATKCVVTVEGYEKDPLKVFGTFDQAQLEDCLGAAAGPPVTIVDGHFYCEKE